MSVGDVFKLSIVVLNTGDVAWSSKATNVAVHIVWESLRLEPKWLQKYIFPSYTKWLQTPVS
jgi:hypothetical protein